MQTLRIVVRKINSPETWRYRERHRKKDTKTDRQTDRQTERQKQREGNSKKVTILK